MDNHVVLAYGWLLMLLLVGVYVLFRFPPPKSFWQGVVIGSGLVVFMIITGWALSTVLFGHR